MLTFGYRGPWKVRFSLERYCKFTKIMCFIPSYDPRAFLQFLLSMFDHVKSIWEQKHHKKQLENKKIKKKQIKKCQNGAQKHIGSQKSHALKWYEGHRPDFDGTIWEPFWDHLGSFLVIRASFFDHLGVFCCWKRLLPVFCWEFCLVFIDF